MQLILSNEALPSVSVADLRRGARRRNAQGVELAVETGAKTHLRDRSVGNELPERKEGHPPIRWLILHADASLTDLLYWSRQAHLVGAGLVLQKTAVETPLCVPLALLHSTDAEAAHRAGAWARMHDAMTCWEVEIGGGDAAQFEDVLDATVPTLAHVRVRGAGPEALDAATEPRMGTLLKKLTLRGYSGTVSLAPAAAGKEDVWRDWLFNERGWGCNTAAKKKHPVD